MNMLAKLALRLISHYQVSGGGRRNLYVACNFNPSCSEYTRQCIIKYGFWQGISRGWQRIRRCNQRDITAVIYDPVP